MMQMALTMMQYVDKFTMKSVHNSSFSDLHCKASGKNDVLSINDSDDGDAGDNDNLAAGTTNLQT